MRIRRGGPADADAVIGRAQGSSANGTFDVRGWQGQVFSMRLGHQPGTAAR
jgi:hypothetical protein